MHVLIRIFVRVLDWIFALGMGGSAGVLVLTAVEDMRTIIGR